MGNIRTGVRIVAEPSVVSGSIGGNLYQSNLIISGINSMVVSNALSIYLARSRLPPPTIAYYHPLPGDVGSVRPGIPIAQGEEACNSLGSANKTRVLFDNSGHSPVADEPALFYDEIITFIRAKK